MKQYEVLTNLKKNDYPAGSYAKGSIFSEDNVPELVKTEGDKFASRGHVRVTEVDDVVTKVVPSRTGTSTATVTKGKPGAKQTPPKPVTSRKPDAKKPAAKKTGLKKKG